MCPTPPSRHTSADSGADPAPYAEPKTRFSDRADAYARARPTYPAAAYEHILDGLERIRPLIVADIGAGTGIASRALAERGCRVLAVEPNDRMRDVGRTSSNAHDIEWIDGAGERTTLPDASVHLIVCAQSFHWMNHAAALAEFHRILAGPARVALLWNIQDRERPATSDYCTAMWNHAVESPRSPWAHPGDAAELVDHPLFQRRYRAVVLPHSQSLDRQGLMDRAFSASYSPKTGPGRESLERTLDTLFTDHAQDGRVTLHYKTELHISERED